MSDHEQRQREIAYFLWQEAGRPDGMELEFWYAAQQREPAARNGQGDSGRIDVGGDDAPPYTAAGPATASPVAKKKKRQKR
jgi:hypothetical protein